ncbi:MAG: alpha/beta fold hydrolase [Bacteroidia bacterium]|nr:alpha/beta fold hydrolase [Bacteroidia bacterium]
MKFLKKLLLFVLLLLCVGIAFLFLYTPPIPQNHGKLDCEFFPAFGESRALVVGFGGGEGGNAWASDYWKEVRMDFQERGYDFLAIGYFGMENTSAYLDRIPLDAIYDSIKTYRSVPKIGLIGGSKGGELVLNLASQYPEINAVVAIVPAHVSFPALTPWANTSSWSFEGEEIPFSPAPLKTLKPMLEGDLHTAFSYMLEDQEALEKSRIPAEKIGGPILLMAADQDEMWPSALMTEELQKHLEEHQFPFEVKKLIFEGGHAEPLEHFDTVFNFLDPYLLDKQD